MKQLCNRVKFFKIGLLKAVFVATQLCSCGTLIHLSTCLLRQCRLQVAPESPTSAPVAGSPNPVATVEKAAPASLSPTAGGAASDVLFSPERVNARLERFSPSA